MNGKPGLPGYWELLWLFFMQPVSLHYRLKACGIEDPDAPGWQLWKQGGAERAYAGRMLVLLLTATPALALGLGWALQAAGFPVGWEKWLIGVALGVALGVASGVASGMAVGVASGVAFGVASGVAFGVTFGVASGVASGVTFGVASGVAFGVAAGVTTGMAWGVASGRISDLPWGALATLAAAGGVVAGVTGAIVEGVETGLVVGLSTGLACALAIIVAYTRFPLYLLESLVEPLLYLWQRLTGKPSLKLSPVLHHELIFFPLPFLAHHIVLAAQTDLVLARRALDACTVALGQWTIAQIALARLQAQELEACARAGRFEAAAQLQGAWLPGLEGADPLLAGFADAARYLQAARQASLAHHRLGHLGNGEKALQALENRLLADRSTLARELRPVLPAWRSALENLRREAQSEATKQVPNPFRSGNALEPEAGMDVFKGREDLVRQVEALLADARNAASLALLGPRRCGKTSLLKMLPAFLPDAVVVLFDLQDNPADSLPGLFAAMDCQARRQARRDRQLDLPALDAQRLQEAPFEAAKAWLDALEEALDGRRLLFCIDEFERLEDLFPGGRRELLQFMGLLRATIQHKRRVRLLVSGAAPFEEWGELWADHFINVRHIPIGHLDRESALGLLTRPIPEFPPEALPEAVALAVWERCRGQPYLTQLYGDLWVRRLNEAGRRTAGLEALEAVEAKVLEQGRYYFSDIYNKAPAAARATLDALAEGRAPAPDAPARRWLECRLLLDAQGGLNIQVFGRWIREEVL